MRDSEEKVTSTQEIVLSAAPRKIFVLSVDYDSCVSPLRSKVTNFQNPDHEMRRHHNGQNIQLLIINLLEQNPESHAVLMIGSARQNRHVDYLGVHNNRNGSVFHAVKIILEQLITKYPQFKDRVTLDTLLMPDVLKKNPSGKEFADYESSQRPDPDAASTHAFSPFYNSPPKLKKALPFYSLVDANKIGMLYAQAHYIANKFPGVQIEFRFFDDVSDIILGAESFYRQWPLLPENTTLIIEQYYLGVRISETVTKPEMKPGTDFTQMVRAQLEKICQAGFIEPAEIDERTNIFLRGVANRQLILDKIPEIRGNGRVKANQDVADILLRSIEVERYGGRFELSPSLLARHHLKVDSPVVRGRESPGFFLSPTTELTPISEPLSDEYGDRYRSYSV